MLTHIPRGPERSQEMIDGECQTSVAYPCFSVESEDDKTKVPLEILRLCNIISFYLVIA